ncbi:hypothetical protein B0H63DRAFT_72793 [Podospora didyma]|uniref:Uncharacterized protein n=1 Tax=Podospora didyma TaxID=330526 RepID=A0AAE0N2W1_9PEZI|nr:hypothetical protein B0H63DRAFT_72793 [Podospora didyma]
MIVPLPRLDSPPSLPLAIQWLNMAPVTCPSSIDWRSHTIENCKFFSRPDAVLSLVIAKEPLGTFKAIVLRAEDGQREALLSESGASIDEVLHALHVKSAEAVQNYISTNGFEFVPVLKKRSSSNNIPNDVDDASDNDSAFSGSASSTVTMSETGSVCESLSDNETVSVLSNGERPAKHDTRKKASKRSSKDKKTAEKAKARRSRSESSPRSPSRSLSRSSSQCRSCANEESEDEDGPSFRPSPPRFRFPRGRCPPPPPPPGWNTHSGMFAQPAMSRIPPPGFPSMPPSGFPSMPPPPPPPPPSAPSPSAPRPAPPPVPSCDLPSPLGPVQPKLDSRPLHGHSAFFPKRTPEPTEALHPVRLLIRWRGHGEHRALEQARLSVSGIRDAALKYIRRQIVVPYNTIPSYMWTMRATVRSATIDGEEYDISGYTGDQLYHLLDCSPSPSASLSAGSPGSVVNKVPRFEVEVETQPPPAMPRPPPGGGGGTSRGGHQPPTNNSNNGFHHHQSNMPPMPGMGGGQGPVPSHMQSQHHD